MLIKINLQYCDFFSLLSGYAKDISGVERGKWALGKGVEGSISAILKEVHVPYLLPSTTFSSLAFLPYVVALVCTHLTIKIPSKHTQSKIEF